jgi:hypothetical protein
VVYPKKSPRKAKRGRPKREGGRDPVLTIRVPKKVKAAIQAKADKEGATPSKVAASILAAALGITDKG